MQSLEDCPYRNNILVCLIVFHFFFAVRILPESVRWLVSKGRTKEARAIIRRAARMNGIPPKQLGLEEMKAAFIANVSILLIERITAPINAV